MKSTPNHVSQVEDKNKLVNCIRCNELYPIDELDRYDYCEHCHDDMFTSWPNSRKNKS